MNDLELLYIIPLSVIILFLMVIVGGTLISIVTGNTEAGEKMIKYFLQKNNNKL
jgi:hypothetical protein